MKRYSQRQRKPFAEWLLKPVGFHDGRTGEKPEKFDQCIVHLNGRGDHLAVCMAARSRGNDPRFFLLDDGEEVRARFWKEA